MKKTIILLLFLVTTITNSFSSRYKSKRNEGQYSFQKIDLKEPLSGSVRGTYHSYELDDGQLVFGSSNVALNIDIDESLGKIIFNPFPSYSPDGAASVWGMGLKSRLKINRLNLKKEIQFDDSDDLMTPWGRFVKGDDKNFYSVGWKSKIKIKFSQQELTAFLPNGTKVYFKVGLEGRNNTTYEWLLKKAISKEGYTSKFIWNSTVGEQRTLQSIQYGGRGDGPYLYQLFFTYKDLDDRYRLKQFNSGRMVYLNKVIEKIEFQSRLKKEDPWQDRWHYGFVFENPVMHKGNNFLVSYQKIYKSGDKEPPTTFKYDYAENMMKETKYEVSETLTKIAKSTGPLAYMPTYLALFDYDQNGLIDFETAGLAKMFLQTEENVFEEKKIDYLPAELECGFAHGVHDHGRNLTRLNGPDSPLVSIKLFDNEFTICTVEGSLIKRITAPDKQIEFFEGKVVDVNSDGKPDIVAINQVTFYAAINESDENGYKFSYKKFRLEDGRVVDSAWLLDINGDGIVDILNAMDWGLQVYHGKGNFEFEKKVTDVTVRNPGPKDERVDLRNHEVTFTDINKDGLLDLFLDQEGLLGTFINYGGEFEEYDFRSVVPNPDKQKDKHLIMSDLSGSSDANIVLFENNKVKNLPLSRPSTGLLIETNDGKGNKLKFEYKMSSPLKPSTKRIVYVSKVTKFTNSKGKKEYIYDYKDPVLHGVKNRFIGYSNIDIKNKLADKSITFKNTESYIGLKTLESKKDKSGIIDLNEYLYEKTLKEGIEGYLLQSQKTTKKIKNSEISTTTKLSKYDNNLCPERKEITTGKGVLEKSFTYQVPDDLKDHLSCYKVREETKSIDLRDNYNFVESYEKTINSIGQIKRESLGTGENTRHLRDYFYDEKNRLEKVVDSQKGQWVYSYWEDTEAPSQVIDNLGIKKSIEERNITNQLPSKMALARDSEVYTKNFGYDGFERLQKHFDDNSSSNLPLESFQYKYGTELEAGYVKSSKNISKNSKIELLNLFGGDGKQLVTSTLGNDGWTFGPLNKNLYESGLIQKFQKRSNHEIDKFIKLDSLYLEANQIAKNKVSGLGFSLNSNLAVAENIQQNIKNQYSISDHHFNSLTTENDKFVTKTATDVSGNTTSWTDEKGNTYTYHYDLANRLRKVVLPDENTQEVFYNSFGDVEKITRSNLGEFHYKYSDNGNIKSITQWDKNKKNNIVKEFKYDSSGRVTEVQFKQKDVEDIVYGYLYDGSTPSGTKQTGHLGHLTGIVGNNFSKTFSYFPDGRLDREQIDYFNGGIFEKSYKYYQDGSAKFQSTVFKGKDDKVQHKLDRSFSYDKLGRLSEISVNNSDKFRIKYDSNNKIKEIIHDKGKFVPIYDPVTRKISSYQYRWQEKDFAFAHQFNNRNLIESESIKLDTKNSLKQYKYDSNGFIENAGSHSYRYNQIGILENKNTNLLYDDFGRLIKSKGKKYIYGPHNQLIEVSLDDKNVSYFYDENHQRIGKFNGTEYEYYLGNSKLIDGELSEPLEIDGFYLGYFEGTEFKAAFTDPRGTSTYSEYSPYGVRDSYDKSSKILDYAKQDRDVDTGLVRMGVRYYSPEIGQFITPDPLFLAKSELCIEDPTSCNLYSYARNNPLRYIDPTGLKPGDVWLYKPENMNRNDPVLAIQRMLGKGNQKGLGYSHTSVELDNGRHFSANPNTINSLISGKPQQRPDIGVMSRKDMVNTYFGDSKSGRVVNVFRHSNSDSFDISKAAQYAESRSNLKPNLYGYRGDVCSTVCANALDAGGLSTPDSKITAPNDFANDSKFEHVGTYDGQRQMSIDPNFESRVN